MRLHPWVFVLCALAIIASILPTPARALTNETLTVGRSNTSPDDLLDEEEIERIVRLQRDAVYTLPISPVRPDDSMVFVTSGDQLAFLNIEDGSSREFPVERLGLFLPLPLLGVTRFNWVDDTGLGALAINLLAETEEEAFVRLRIDSDTMRVSASPLILPPRIILVSVSPNLRNLLVAQLPEEEDEGEEDVDSILARVQVTRPGPASSMLLSRALPSAVQRRIAEARRRQPAALARIWAMRDEDDGTLTAATRTLDLLMLSDEGARYVTTIPEASAGFSEAWSRDSSHLAVSFIGQPDPEATRPQFDGALLSEEVYRDATGNLPPSRNPILQNNNTYVIDVASGDVQILRPSAGAAPPLLAAQSWSPDNKTLLVQAWHPARIKGRTHPIYTPQFSERVSLRFYELGEDGLREAGALENDLFSAPANSSVIAEFISPDELILRGAAGTDRHPYYYNRVSGELRNLADRAGGYYNVFSTNHSREIVFTYTSFTEPPDVYRMGWDGRGLTRLTWFGEELRQFANLRQDPVRFTLPNGQTRVGVLIQPADAPFPPRNTRIVVWQEGGPGPAMVNMWNASVERPFALLPGMGIALLVTPLAGRAGYSPAVFNSLADGANFGQIDIDEQAAIVRDMIRRGWTSPDKVGITGCSYGGYVAAQSVVRHPDLYAAANVQCALVDVISEWTRGYHALVPYLQGLPPYSSPEEYRRDSPAYNVDRIKAAVLTFHGTEDFLPIVQNQNLHLRLVNRGVPARMVIFAGEGHGLANEDNQTYAAQEQVHWFRTHLK